MPKINKKKQSTKKTQSTKKKSISKKTRKNPYDMIITRESTRKVKPTQKALENQKLKDKIRDAKRAAKNLKEARDRARKEFAELTDLFSGTTLNSKSDSSDDFLANMMMDHTLGPSRPPRNPFGPPRNPFGR